MLLRLRNWVVVIALAFATGGHWAVLQSIAWVGMTIQYSRSDGIGTALQKTFSGDHPCKMCKAVQEGRESERKQASLKVETKLDLFLSASNPRLNRSVIPNTPGWRSHGAGPRTDRPPTPPPRLA